MKKYYLLLILTIISCNNSTKVIPKENIAQKKELKKFYESDKIDHYYLDISEDAFFSLMKKENKTQDDKSLAQLLVASNYPNSISQPNFESDLKKFHFAKHELNKEKKKEIENIFSQQDSLRYEYAGCLPKYRDIFIFKKNDSIIGIAKVCFGCGVSQFLGTKVDTDGFGLQTELEKLEKIIRN
ncbi:hypothetical protein OA93_06505 [Flavobacterium sp. KMS]|uniref:hypothetical protein n=1 Tax=Flavobacterium sp. KMS TaxID=1566023 RepID=UPI00057F8A1F|nr:hypothetical protein [Flavobacterium sp. KMS]KIA99275.1 hypothetical protein OA93_06505 [Flavobacterium sp. KMS]